MIIQPPATGNRHTVLAQLEHTRIAGRFASSWGNDVFSQLTPRALMEYVVLHHDQGWEAIDATIGQDPDTGLPFNLVSTPIPSIIKSGSIGPAFNTRHHPYCGLLSSMHTYGLFTGRYGMSDKVFVDMVPKQHRPAVEDLLVGEQMRQDSLRTALATDPESAPWVDPEALFHNYKLLQFFDTLSLYFNCSPDEQRGRSVFQNVPRSVGDDVEITVNRLDRGRYSVTPYPFHEPSLRIAMHGRWLPPQPSGSDMAAALAEAEETTELVTLEAA